MNKIYVPIAVLCVISISLMTLCSCSIISEHFPELDLDFNHTTAPPVTTTSHPVNTTWSPPAQSPGFTLENWAEAVEKVRPSVVAVETSTGSGSGWIIDSGGIIVTNEHVVEGASEAGVVLSDGRYLEAVSIYTDVVTDIAVIYVNASGLPAASIGSSSSLKVGQPVAAVGNALGLGISMKGGWVSQLNVSTVIDDRSLYGLIETDAAMNPGNSGGPLINLAGEVVGITNAKLVDVTIEGVGYAISIDSALPVIERLITEGSISYPFLGIWGMITVNPAIAGFFELDIDQGVLIQGVTPGTGAEAGGLKAGDVILSIDEEPTLTVEELVWAIRSKEIGQTVNIKYYRGGLQHTATVTLSEYI
ncbi:MAG: trypsin-like peptidase domain-containing protein [Dehalococcoidales bacterium]|nr:trypsin-like peptidase domain-containing protein [Dehalococcoidales bacterium]MDD4230134.1 trypsin-like peptidase domain-containing protein [Dehalococcoidales bacterium]